MANVKNALKLVKALFFVVKVRGLPSQCVPGGGFEVAFFGHVVLLWIFLWIRCLRVFLKALMREP
jgi:hypothetical protein